MIEQIVISRLVYKKLSHSFFPFWPFRLRNQSAHSIIIFTRLHTLIYRGGGAKVRAFALQEEGN